MTLDDLQTLAEAHGISTIDIQQLPDGTAWTVALRDAERSHGYGEGETLRAAVEAATAGLRREPPR